MNTIVGVSEYRKEDYQEIYNLSEDKHAMDDTWEEWKASKNRALTNFQNIGLKTVDILVTPKELVQYCRENNFKINGKSRSQFVSHKVSILYK